MIKPLLLALILTLSLAGCSSLPLRPGRARMDTGQIHTEVRQSQNPQSATTQKYVRVTESPAGGKTTESNEVVIGAAQKDTGREIAAKLGSLKGVVWLGVFVFLFGVASAFYPPLKLVVGSVTTSGACAVAGLALVFLPSIIVGHELLIMGVSLGVVALWFLAHRHGQLRGSLDVLLKDK